MDGKPSAPGEPRQSAEADGPSSTGTGDPESFGVVELTRRVKDDGRTLIVFTRPDER